MRIFLSYSRDDLKVAEQIAANLTQAGHHVFFDRHSIKVAEDFNRVIWREIRKAHLFVFLISPNSVDAGSYTLTELELAEKKWPNPEHRLLPVTIAPTELGQIPVYATLVDMLQPEGNVAAEVRAAVRALHKRHRRANLWRTAAGIAGIVLAGVLAVQGYQAYLDHGPIAARTRLAEMNLPYTDEAFLESAQRGDLDAVKLFLTAGMDPNTAGGSYRYTALEHAVDNHQFDVVKTLLEVENIAVDRALVMAARYGQEAFVRALLEAGVTAEARNQAFVVAAGGGHLAVLRLLLAGDVEQASINEAFIEAAESRPEIMRFLQDRISSVPATASRALLETADAASGADIGSVKFLLGLGADVNTAAANGDTPLIRTLRRLRDADQTEVVRLLLEQGADVNAKGSGGTTPLMVAAGKDVALVELLLAQGARVDDRNEDGTTALHSAAAYGNAGTVKALLEAGAEVDAVCKCPESELAGGTALFRAVERARYRTVQVLVAGGADVNRKNSHGQTVLMIAAARGLTDIVRALLRAGASTAAEDGRGRTAETLARRGQHTEVIELLQAAAPASASP